MHMDAKSEKNFQDLKFSHLNKEIIKIFTNISKDLIKNARDVWSLKIVNL